MEINSTILLRSIARQLVVAIELADKIPDEDFKEIVMAMKKHEKHIKSVSDAMGYGNLFMTLYFLRELVDSLTHEMFK
jgi:Na+-transporting NADH:ubiquinone oxidoreductase subunit NqrD